MRFHLLAIWLLIFSLVQTGCETNGAKGGGTTFAAVKSYADQNSIDPGPVKVHYLGSTKSFHYLGVREQRAGASNTFPGKIFKVAKGGEFFPAMEYTYMGTTSRMSQAF